MPLPDFEPEEIDQETKSVGFIAAKNLRFDVNLSNVLHLLGTAVALGVMWATVSNQAAQASRDLTELKGKMQQFESSSSVRESQLSAISSQLSVVSAQILALQKQVEGLDSRMWAAKQARAREN